MSISSVPRLWLNPRRKPVLYVTNSLLGWTLTAGSLDHSRFTLLYPMMSLLINILCNSLLPLLIPLLHTKPPGEAPQGAPADTNIQKAFINGVPGCAEHQCKLAPIIKEATENCLLA